MVNRSILYWDKNNKSGGGTLKSYLPSWYWEFERMEEGKFGKAVHSLWRNNVLLSFRVMGT